MKSIVYYIVTYSTGFFSISMWRNHIVNPSKTHIYASHCLPQIKQIQNCSSKPPEVWAAVSGSVCLFYLIGHIKVSVKCPPPSPIDIYRFKDWKCNIISLRFCFISNISQVFIIVSQRATSWIHTAPFMFSDVKNLHDVALWSSWPGMMSPEKKSADKATAAGEKKNDITRNRRRTCRELRSAGPTSWHKICWMWPKRVMTAAWPACHLQNVVPAWL